MWQKLQLLRNKLTNSKNKKIFFAELIGTFTVIVFAIGSVVLDAKLNGALGLPFIVIAPAIAVTIGGSFIWKNIHGTFQSCSNFGIFNYQTYGKKKRIAFDLPSS